MPEPTQATIAVGAQATPETAPAPAPQNPAQQTPATPSVTAAPAAPQTPAAQKQGDEDAEFQDILANGRITGDTKIDRDYRRFRSENQALRQRALDAEAKEQSALSLAAQKEAAFKQRLVDTRLRAEIIATLGINPGDETPEGKQRLALVNVILPGARDLVNPSVKFGENFDFTADFKSVVDLVKSSFGQAVVNTPSSGTSATITVPGIKPGSSGSAPSSPSMPANHTHPSSGAFVAALGTKR